MRPLITLAYAASCLIAMATNVLAQTVDIDVKVGEFCGYWRFVKVDNQPDPSGTPNSKCSTHTSGETTFLTRNNCTVSIEPGAYKFQVWGMGGGIHTTINAGGVVSFPNSNQANTDKTGALNGGLNLIKLNTTQLTVQPAQFRGYYNFDKIDNGCAPEHLFTIPVGNFWGTNTGVYPNGIIHTDHNGNLDRVSNSGYGLDPANNKTLTFLPTPVLIAPTLNSPDTAWVVKNSEVGGRVNEYLSGTRVVPLIAGGSYLIELEKGFTGQQQAQLFYFPDTNTQKPNVVSFPSGESFIITPLINARP